MPSFRYTAKDKNSKQVNGTQEAPDEKSLIVSLRNQGLVVMSIALDKGGKPKKMQPTVLSKFGSKIKMSELVLFSRQLATMIDSGIPLVQSLEILSEQIENKAFKGIMMEVKKDVTTGASFNEALKKHPRAFSPLFVNMVKAGEASGALDDIMERLATYLEKTESLIRKVRSAMIYPIVVTCMAFGITLLMLLKVVPVFAGMFEDFNAELPAPTQFLINLSELLQKTFAFWFVGAIVAGFMLKRFLNTPKGTELFDRFKLNMPVFGIIMRKVAVSKFARTLSTLVKSGVPILGALEIVGKTSGNTIIEHAIDNVRVSIREGENISDPLAKSKVFPPLVVRMVAVGEQTGQLEKMLTKIADFYDDQVDAAVSGLTSLIEPLIIAFLGVVIGGIVICMFMPIFKLSSVIQ